MPDATALGLIRFPTSLRLAMASLHRIRRACSACARRPAARGLSVLGLVARVRAGTRMVAAMLGVAALGLVGAGLVGTGLVGAGLAIPASAQPAAAILAPGDAQTADGTDAPKYWIFLADRLPPSATSARPASSASARARHRRAVRGAPSPALTRPVSPRYLAALRAAGVRPIVRSRWLHAVSARLTPAQRRRVRALAVVDSTRRLGRAVPTRHPGLARHAASAQRAPSSARDRHAAHPLVLAFPTAPMDLSGRTGRPAPADSSLYGPSYTQLQLMNALAPLDRGISGRGVRIGFLDTGYRGLRHPAFDAMRADDRLLGVRDFTEKPQTNNHGGGVVSATAGYDPGFLIGPAHSAEVLAASTEYTPSETNVEEDYFVAGLEWLEARGVDVVNVSLGYTTFDEGERSYTVDDLDGDTGVTTRAVDAAAQLGVTVVVSAGNSGCADPDNCWYYVGTPADADSAITVGAVGADSSRVGFSSRGPTADGRIKPDVSALGRGVVSAWETSDYARVNGTSFSSPLVTGVVAQMLQQNPRLRPMQVRRLLRQTASQAREPDNDVGWGVVNADAAVRAAERLAREQPPSILALDPPFPSPASRQVTFALRAPRTAASVEITLVDVLGRAVRRVDRSLRPGPNTIQVSVADLSSGIYLYRLRTATTVRTGKLTVVQ